MRRLIILFALVLSMIKTNAQTSFYYYKNERINLHQAEDKLLIKIANGNDQQNKLMLKTRILNDPNFNLAAPGIQNFEGDYYLLERKIGASIGKAGAINYYIQEPYVASASFLYKTETAKDVGVTNEIIVKANQDIEEQQLRQLVAQYECIEIQTNLYNSRQHSLFFKAGAKSVLDIANALFETGYFEYAEPGFYMTSGLDCSTTDPYFGSQWALQNTGQYGGTPAADIAVCNAWPLSKGSSVKVAVLDNGVDLTHPDLTVISGYDVLGRGTNGGCDKSDWHGTHCAGVIGAIQNNGIGVSGIAPECVILPVRFLTGNRFTTPDARSALEWAWRNGADVISNSWNLSTPASVIDDEIAKAVTSGRSGRGCVIVFSAANDNSSTLPAPANNDNVISVGAMSMCNQRKSPSSCDGETWGSNYGVGLDVVAPGVKIHTTDNQGTDGLSADDYYAFSNGTSSACPHVSGVAALILSANPCLTQKEIRDIIELSARKVGSYGYTTSLPNGAWNNEMGYGLINVENAVKLAYHIYKQNKTETRSVIYSGPRKLFAGYDVTTILQSGNYTINSGANITFNVPEAILLTPGFTSNTGAIFTAEIKANACNSTHGHYKTSEENSVATAENPVENGRDALSGFNVYPNPANEKISIAFGLYDAVDVTFTITNIIGQKILEKTASGLATGRNTQEIAVNELLPGAYLINLKTPYLNKQFKFIKH